ncbi:HAMP domain-containing histidine kinase [Bacillus aquiflavi]|uniref:histidine kinase n=1 Tax=Bacillus aquiflavi TaxID=2672567 RepID=A0A6B3VTM6_9BACI|nr:HAMP domain-containing sensor histidine kinase [Bacillus aquiflavi]MBA4537364.1 HAMP domain-containing histidine kinase [Bacillus aquiflavi]NEY81620.1 HAMP domain-containing histidine kinase [Bacillus aquiflavi]UAC49188.1 HAMP domain-containing histidine kinase [Bacillus aquiflavi]
MFNPVRIKLTLLYTGSFLILLLIFIVLLSYFITNSIEEQQKEELIHYFEKEEEEFIEELEEKEQEEVELKTDRAVFYYLFNTQHDLIEGKETIAGFSNKAKTLYTESSSSFFLKEAEYEGAHLLIMRQPLQDDGYLLGYVIIGTEITSQKHLIEKIVWGLMILTIVFSVLLAILSYYLAGKAMQPIQNAFNSQKKFVSDASHELRTPLSIFYSSLELLEREEKNKLSPLGQEVLADMKLEATLMNKLLEDLLLIARNDHHQFMIKTELVPLSELITSIGKRFAVKIPAHLQFITQIEENIKMMGDPIRIQQLLYILLQNAIVYTEKGSIKLLLKRTNGQILIQVIDTGTGIKKQDLQHIFDRFYRADTSRVRNGTGLGLSIAKIIVETHKGKLAVESEFGKGSTFTIIFNQ